jgi:hypothetical protein
MGLDNGVTGAISGPYSRVIGIFLLQKFLDGDTLNTL